MDLEETASEVVDGLVSDAETVATAAYLYRNKLGLTPEPGVDAPGGVERPTLAPETGPRVSPDEWDKRVQADFKNKVSAPESIADTGPRMTPDQWDESVKAGFKNKADAAAVDAAPKPDTPAHTAAKVEAADTSNKKPAAHAAETPAHAPAEAKVALADAPEASASAPKPASVKAPAADVPPAHDNPASSSKTSPAKITAEMHTAKAPTAPDIGHGHGHSPLKSSPALDQAAAKGLHRAETAVAKAAAELAVKEAASVAAKGAMRVLAPEAALAAAVVSAIPDAYTFVDEASGHAISKSALGQGVAYLNEQSGANAAARQVGGWVDSGLAALENAASSVLEKTGGDKVLVEASQFVGRMADESGLSAGLAKAGALWDAGAAKLEQAIRDNVHGPDNPAHKAAAAVAAAAAPAHAPAEGHPAKAAAVAPSEGAHAAGATGQVPGAQALPHKEATKPAHAYANKTADASHSKPHGSATGHHQPAAHAERHPAHDGALEASQKPSEHHAAPSGPARNDLPPTLTGSAGLAQALEGHMSTHGMGAEAKLFAEPMARVLSDFLAESPNSATHLVISPKNDAVATLTGPGAAPAAGDLPRIQSETLENVAKAGICPAGVGELRECLPAETKGKSDLELADVVGVAAISKIGEKGIDVPAVDKLQEHIVKSTEATEFAVAPDRLSAVKMLHEMGERENKDFAVIERSDTGTRLVGAMSESEFVARPSSPGRDLMALDVSDLRKELGLAESGAAQSAEATKAASSTAALTETPGLQGGPSVQAPQPKPEAPDPGPVMER